VVEDALGSEVVETGLLGLEFEADQREALSVDNADGRESSKGLCAVLKNLIVNWGITSVDDLDCLVDRFVGSSWREDNLV
jgi:hypothetical protein